MDISSISVNPVHFALVVALLNGLGKAAKEMPFLNNRVIPILLCAVGGVAHGFLSGWSAESIIVGATAGLGAVGVHQLATNTAPEKSDSEEK